MKVTRRTKLGFGYTSRVEQTERGLRVCKVLEPDRFGTVKQLMEANENDRTLQSFRSGVSYRVAWFAKVAGKWAEIEIKDVYPSVTDLLVMLDGEHWIDAVEVDVVK